MAKVQGINRAVVYSEPPALKTEIKEFPIPEPSAGEVLVRLYAKMSHSLVPIRLITDTDYRRQYSGVCHTDWGFCTNSYVGVPPTPAGQVGGHEGKLTILTPSPGSHETFATFDSHTHSPL